MLKTSSVVPSPDRQKARIAPGRPWLPTALRSRHGRVVMSFALSPCSPMAIGQDAFQAGIRHLDRGASSISLADARLLGVGLKVRPARLLRHPEHVLGQIQLVGVLAGCGILGGPLNVHHSNYARHVGLVLE